MMEEWNMRFIDYFDYILNSHLIFVQHFYAFPTLDHLVTSTLI